MSTSLIKTLQENSPTLEALMAIALHRPQGTDIHALVMQEISYVEERIMRNPDIAKCTPESMLLCVKKAIKDNLTLDPDAGLMYMIPGSVKTGNKEGGKDVYVKVVDAPRTVNGELSVAYQCGTILDHERPTVQYNDNKQVISITVKLLRPSYGNPRWEEIVYDGGYFRKWMAASHKKNAMFKQDADANTLNYANALYRSFNGGIDPEFAIAKALRHSLKKLGTNPNAKMNSILAPLPVDKRVDTTHEEAEIIEELQISPDQL